MTHWQAEQRKICRRFQAPPLPAPASLKVGIARNVQPGIEPINGMRCKPEGDTIGWYLWSGEGDPDPDFFVPLCVEHVETCCPAVIPYLQLPPGWRILLAAECEDVWFDSRLIDEE